MRPSIVLRLQAAALYGTAYLACTASVAAADELSSLKERLEELQAQVDHLESAVPSRAEASLVSIERGQGVLAYCGQDFRDRSGNNPESGFTLAITPKADVPAPVVEIVVYGDGPE